MTRNAYHAFEPCSGLSPRGFCHFDLYSALSGRASQTVASIYPSKARDITFGSVNVDFCSYGKVSDMYQLCNAFVLREDLVGNHAHPSAVGASPRSPKDESDLFAEFHLQSYNAQGYLMSVAPYNIYNGGG